MEIIKVNSNNCISVGHGHITTVVAFASFIRNIFALSSQKCIIIKYNYNYNRLPHNEVNAAFGRIHR